MKEFKITMTAPATSYWTYFVKAETEEQAIKLVESGELDPDDHDTISDENDVITFLESEEIETI